jgi:hypothetical protein
MSQQSMLVHVPSGPIVANCAVVFFFIALLSAPIAVSFWTHSLAITENSSSDY